MKLHGSTKQLIDKTQNGENIPSIEVIETVLVDCNLVDNQSLRYSGPILESKGMCDFSGKGQNI